MPRRFFRPTPDVLDGESLRLPIREIRPVNAQSFRLTVDKVEISASRITGLSRDAGNENADQAPMVTIVRPLDHRQLFYAWRRKIAKGQEDRRVVRIHLYDGPPVIERLRHTFVLRDAVPVSWTGPDLDARVDTLAEERVELAYSALLWIPAAPEAN